MGKALSLASHDIGQRAGVEERLFCIGPAVGHQVSLHKTRLGSRPNLYQGAIWRNNALFDGKLISDRLTLHLCFSFGLYFW